MSISNHLCGNGPSVGYVQCWVPVAQNLGVGGFKDMINKAKNLAKAGWHGGSAEEHRLFDELMKELKSDNDHMKEYVKNGTVESQLEVLVRKIVAYEMEYDKNHPENHHMKIVLDAPGAAQSVQRPPAYVPAPTAPFYPASSFAHQWVLVPYYSAPLSSSRWSCHAP